MARLRWKHWVLALVTTLASAYMYGVYRVAAGTVGLHAGSIGTGLISTTLSALVPVVSLAWLAASALEFVRVQRGLKRSGRGQCVQCGYDVGATERRCPECGAASPRWLRRPMARGQLRRLLAVALVSMVVGVVLGEALMLADERAFRREAAAWELAGGVNQFTRPRWWPGPSASMVYIPGKGIFSTD